MNKKKNYLDNFKLRNKISIVIGGSGLIGKEICQALSQVGSKVINLDIKRSTNSKNIKYEYFNVKDIDFKIKLNQIKKKYGSPTILVNTSYPSTSDWAKNTFEKLTDKSYKQNIDLHLNSYVLIAKKFADFLKKEKLNGCLVLLSSIYGIVAQDMNFYQNSKLSNNFTYPVIKGSINMLTKQMASYYGKYGIRINSICPSGIVKREGKLIKYWDKKFQKNYINHSPLKKFCTKEDVASATIFLSSDASKYITGVNLLVDGGWTIV